MATLSPSTLARFEDMLRPPRRGGSLGRGRKSQAIRGQDFELRFGSGKGDPASRSAKALATFERIASKAPEVVVKRTGKQSSGSHALANFTYISRLGHGEGKELELVTNKGQTLTTGEQMQALAKRWEAWHEEDKARRKGPVSYSIIFSMPKGTEPQAVKEAALEVARRECPDQGWVLALHNDRDHVHAHLTVQARDQHGERQYFPRARMVEMREAFAEELRERGIEANATSRRARGKGDRDLPASIVRESDRAAKKTDGYVRSTRIGALEQKLAQQVRDGVTHDPIDTSMQAARAKVVEVYGDVARELSASSDSKDQALAKTIQNHVASMPTPRSRFAEIRDKLQQSFTRDKSDIQALAKEAFSRAPQTGRPARLSENAKQDDPATQDRIKALKARLSGTATDKAEPDRASSAAARLREQLAATPDRLRKIQQDKELERDRAKERSQNRDGPRR